MSSLNSQTLPTICLLTCFALLSFPFCLSLPSTPAVVPPGYYLSASSMLKCGNTATGGTFREGWVMYSDPKAQNCTACGDNILSEPRDLDENPLAPNGTLVRSTSTSCCESPSLVDL
jgi:hypothetical protein